MNTDKTRLQQARQQYESIPVPPQLQQRLEETIQQHPYQTPTPIQHPFKKRIQRILTIAAVCFLSTFSILNMNPSIAQAVEDIPVLGTITHIFTVQSWQQQADNTSMRVEQPALNGAGALSQSINTQIDKIITQCTAQAQQRLDEYKVAFFATGGTEKEWLEHNFQVDVNYQITCQSDRYLSFTLTSVENWNNASQQTWFYNLDLQTAHLVTLQDLLGDDYIRIVNSSIQQQMTDRMATDDTISYFSADMGGFTTIDDTTNFYINQNGNPVIVFDRYTIAPGAMGQQEFEIVVP